MDEDTQTCCRMQFDQWLCGGAVLLFIIVDDVNRLSLSCCSRLTEKNSLNSQEQSLDLLPPCLL